MNRKIITALAGAVVALVCLNAAPQAALAQDKDEVAKNIAVVRKFYDEFSKGNTKVILEVHPPMIKMHYANDAEDVETKVLYDDLTALKKANPDLKAVIHDIFGAGDIVVTNFTWTTTHTGDYFGIPATGKTSMHNGIVVRRLKDGKIVESWEMFDDLAFMQSIGYLPSWDDIVAQGPMQEASLVGIWRGRPGSAGDPPQTLWKFKADGTYQVAFTKEQLSDGFSVETGKYTTTNGELKFEATSGSCASGEAKNATYQLQLTSKDVQPSQLALKVVSDKCTPRANALRGPMPIVK